MLIVIKNRLSPKVTLIHVIARSEMNKEDKKKGEKGTYKKGDTQKRGQAPFLSPFLSIFILYCAISGAL